MLAPYLKQLPLPCSQVLPRLHQLPEEALRDICRRLPTRSPIPWVRKGEGGAPAATGGQQESVGLLNLLALAQRLLRQPTALAASAVLDVEEIQASHPPAADIVLDRIVP